MSSEASDRLRSPSLDVNGAEVPGANLASARSVIVDRLRREILSGQLPAGTRLMQNQIAQRMQTSTTPVREAFGVLAAEGLVDLHPRRGASVHRLSRNELTELQTLRTALEPIAVEFAVKNARPGEFDALEDLVQAMDEVENLEEWIELNSRFHDQITAIARQPLLASMLTTLRSRARLYLANAIRYSDDHMVRANKEHREILKACKEGDPDLARRLVQEHFVNSRVQELTLDQDD